MKKIKTKDILASLFATNNFAGHKKPSKIFFPKSFKTYKTIKQSLKTIDESAEFLAFPYNELISLISQSDFWSKEELKKLDEQMSEIVKRHLIKVFAQNF